MLRELVIRDFAIVDRLELSLGPGLTCLTGETGAGKSILVDAIGFILGARPGPGCAREGAETSVEAQFDISGMTALDERLEELGLGGGGELVIRRAVSPGGRGKVFVNGSLANVAALQEIGDFLVDMHGQHEHQSLLKVDRHLDMLDEYLTLGPRRALCRDAYGRLSAVRAKLAGLAGRERERARREDLLRYQVSEIDSSAPVPGEDGELAGERARLMHADRLRQLSHSALEGLKDNDVSALSILKDAGDALSEIASLVPGQSETRRLVESAAISVGEACATIRDFAAGLESDPERLAEVDDRLELIKGLKKKYGDTVDDILKYRENAAEEVAGIERAGEEASELTAEAERAQAGLMEAARELSVQRKKGADGFAGKVQSELADMGMPRAVFGVTFTELDEPGPRGFEKAEFMFSANPGKEPLPLAKVASGGELSRVMLALRVILSREDSVPTLVFDEVDSGVGGVTAGAVGRKLRSAADGRQVLCITHLPQIASLAREHFTVEKRMDGAGVKVLVRRLDKRERVDELARMLGGEGSKTASAHAEELVRQGEG